MSFEKDMLRKTAGLPFSTKKASLFEGRISKIRTLDVETEMLRIFASTIRDIKRIRDLMEGNQGNNYYGTIGGGNPNGYKLKDESGDIDKKYLFELALGKLDLVEESLAECFGIKREEHEEEYDDSEESSEEDW